VEEGYNGLSITGELSWVLNFKGGKEEIVEYGNDATPPNAPVRLEYDFVE